MTPANPVFLAFFFSIFHAFGGAAVGRALRTLQSEPGNSIALLIWGGLMGLGPILFDWFFLIRENQLIYGLIGPGIFLLIVLVSGLLWRGALEEIDGKAIAATALGSASFLIGVAITPDLIGIALTRSLGAADWIFGTVMVLMFVGVGASFAWTGLMAIFHGHTFDDEMKRRQHARDPRESKRQKP